MQHNQWSFTWIALVHTQLKHLKDVIIAHTWITYLTRYKRNAQPQPAHSAGRMQGAKEHSRGREREFGNMNLLHPAEICWGPDEHFSSNSAAGVLNTVACWKKKALIRFVLILQEKKNAASELHHLTIKSTLTCLTTAVVSTHKQKYRGIENRRKTLSASTAE